MPEPLSRDWLRYAAGRLPNAGPEVQAELAQHLEQAYADALSDGQSEPDAAAWAESRFADWRRLDVDIADSKRRAHPLAGTGGDLRQALRLFRFHPGLAALAVATLAFGIGGNTAIFTLADTLSLRGLPYPNADRLMSIETTWPRQREIESWTSALDFFDLRSRAKSLEGIAGISPVWNDVLTGAGPAERLETLYVSASFFSILGVHPQLGRTLEAGDDVGVGGKRVAVLSNWFWSSRFGARRDIVGQSITLNGAPFTVVGVLPRDFHYLGSPLAGKTAEISAWMPLGINQIIGTPRGVRFLKVIAGLKPSVGVDASEAEVHGIGQSLSHEYPFSNDDVRMDVVPLAARISGAHRATAWLLLGAVGLVLLMACANVASLLLARASVRGREVAVRAALGASRYRIVRLLLSEGLTLACAGGVLGWIIAWQAARVLNAWAPPGLLAVELRLDWRAFFIAVAATLVCTLTAGLTPAWRLLSADLNFGLRQGGRGLMRGSHRLRGALTSAEIAVAFAMLVGSGLLIHSFSRLLEISPGFDARNLVSISTQAPPSITTPGQRTAFYRRMHDALTAMPEVDSVDATSRLPLAGSDLGASVQVEGHVQSPGEGLGVQFRRTTPGYFATMRIPLRAGRIFDEHDGASEIALISETMQRKFWPGESAIGRRIKLGPDPAHTPWTTVVGVVGDVRHYALDADAPATVYTPYAISPLYAPILVIRTRYDADRLLPILAAKIRSLDPNLPAYNLYSMQELIDRSTAQRRFVMSLLSAFAVAALVLAAVGVFGAVSQAVAQRTREIGLRMALGSTPAEAVRLVFRDGMRFAVIGIAFGIAIAAALARVLRTLLFEVQPLDPAAFTGASLVLLIFAALACYLPARRATRIDPLLALRAE